MNPRDRSVLRWAVVALVALFAALAIALRFRLADDARTAATANVGGLVRSELAFLVAAIVGAVILGHRRGHVVGRLLLALGVVFALYSAAESYARWALLVEGGAPFGALAAAWVTSWGWIVVFALIGGLLLRFPDGRPPAGHLWRATWVGLLVGAGLLLATFPFASADLGEELGHPPNPMAAPDALVGVLGAIGALGYLLLLAATVLCAASLVLRWRRARRADRQQLEWIAFAGAFLAIGIVLNALLPDAPAHSVVGLFSDLALIGVFVAIGIAIVAHRLYDIELVINRALVFAVLALFVTAAYVAIVVGLGAVVGRPADGDLWLPIAATAIVAVAFSPVRERAQRLANRVVYGERQAPYDALADLGRRLAGSVAPADLLPAMAESVAAAVGAHTVVVEVMLPDGSVLRARVPAGDTGGLDAGGPETFVVPIDDGGEPLGQLVVTMAPGDALRGGQRDLLADLARQAGIAVRNVRLGLEVQRQFEQVSAQAVELQSSRRRIVDAQDTERRRLERDIHDGAQQELVAVTLQLRTLAARAPADTAEALEQIRRHVTGTLADLRDLARGIYPPLLVEAGVGPALAAHLTKTTARARLIDDLPEGWRAPRDIEAATYFCCLEALQNTAKHAGPDASAVVGLALVGDELCFEVSDDGAGFTVGADDADGSGLVGLRDRVGAAGGHLEVRSAPGRGTAIEGQIPVDRGAGTTVVG